MKIVYSYFFKVISLLALTSITFILMAPSTSPNIGVTGVIDNIFCYKGRLLPKLFILGCMKCASTSLYHDNIHLINPTIDKDQIVDSRTHDQIKEKDVLNKEYKAQKGLDFYSLHFSKVCDRIIGHYFSFFSVNRIKNLFQLTQLQFILKTLMSLKRSHSFIQER